MPRDPYRNFKFVVEITGFEQAGFAKVTGLQHSIEVIDYREGGENEVMRKLPGQSTFEPVVLERGCSDSQMFNEWISLIFSSDRIDGNQPDETSWRRTVTIYLRDKSGNRVKKWTVLNAWPSQHMVNNLDASGNEVLIETLTLQNEGIKEESLTTTTP
jgi:phage tail-like protein